MRRRLIAVAAAATLLAVPAVITPYGLVLACSTLVLAIAALGVNLLLGHAGLLSLGHAAYFGTGAYAGAFLFTFFDVWSLEIYLLVGVAASAGLAAVAGGLCVRSSRLHFAILTLALAESLRALFVSGAAFQPFGDVGKGFYLVGEGGLYIPRLHLLGREVGPERFVPVLYYVILAAFVACVALLDRTARSPFGLALRGARDSAVRAAFVRVDVRAIRWRAFVLSGAVTGLAGALAGLLDRQVTPEQLGWLLSARLVVAVVLGGPASLGGPVLGAAILTGLSEVAHRVSLAHNLVLGALLIGVALRCPGGLAEAVATGRARLERLAGRRGHGRRRPGSGAPAGTA
jgi:branched-chain amino acid transport system permease protein